MAEDAKAEKMHRVAQAVLGLVARNGLDAVNPSRLARSAGVSRAWIYKYLGGNKGGITSFALEHFGILFAQINDPKTPLSPHRNQFLADEMRRFQVATEWGFKHPELLVIYFRYKGSPTPLGKSIDKLESAYRSMKVKQLMSAFGLQEGVARVQSDLLASMKLSLIHRWVQGGLHKQISEEMFFQSVERLIKAFEEKRTVK